MSITVKTTKAGERRYEVRLRDPSGREYAKTFRTRREAERYEDTQRADRARGSWLDPRTGDVTFGDWATEWLASDPGKSPSSVARDEDSLKVHVLATLGARRLASITPRKVQALVTRWAATAKPRTVRRQDDTVRAIFTAAFEADLIGRSPCRRIRLPQVDIETRPVLDAAGLAGLAAAVGPDYSALVYVAGVLGLRWGETAGLRVGAVDFAAATVTISEQRTRGHGGATVTRAPKIKAGRRTISAPTWLLELLEDHLRRRGLTPADVTQLVFVAANGDGLDYAHWRQRVWMPAVRAAGVAGLRFHDLRRTAATALVLDGVDLKTAQTRLGHADPRTTIGLYAQATQKADRDAAEALGTRFRPPTTAPVVPADLPSSRRLVRAFRGLGGSGDSAEEAKSAADLHLRESGRRDSNPRPQRPECIPAVLTRTDSNCSGWSGAVSRYWRMPLNDLERRRMCHGCAMELVPRHGQRGGAPSIGRFVACIDRLSPTDR
ncbi:MAG TPA: site-specific integrase [Acidimicrobiales bacterium]|nr:site-specific integrase [Acidimicrobiales bacterium]